MDFDVELLPLEVVSEPLFCLDICSCLDDRDGDEHDADREEEGAEVDDDVGTDDARDGVAPSNSCTFAVPSFRTSALNCNSSADSVVVVVVVAVSVTVVVVVVVVVAVCCGRFLS